MYALTDVRKFHIHQQLTDILQSHITSHHMAYTDAGPRASISDKYTKILLFIHLILIYNTPVSGVTEVCVAIIDHFLVTPEFV